MDPKAPTNSPDALSRESGAGAYAMSSESSRASAEADFAALRRATEPGRLEGIDLLDGLTDDELRNLERECLWLTAREGDVILSSRAESRHVLFIVEGQVEVVNYSLSGREVMYAVTEAGAYIGEVAAIDGKERSATVVALSACQLAALPPDSFRALMMARPHIGMRVMEKLATIVRNNNERIMDLATLSAYQRVYSELLKMVRPDPVRQGSWLVYPLPTQATIASKASTTRETVARVLSQLQQAGITQRKTKTLYVRDLDRLQTLADRISLGTPPQERAEAVLDEDA